MTRLFVACVLVVFTIALSECAIPGDKIHSLPGYDHLDVAQYAGYINVSKDQHFFYWFVESQRSPQDDPLVIWMNGGPGCSSLMGYWSENGPLHMDDSDTIKIIKNPYSWNRIANVLYLESPAGVGMSYSDGFPKKYETDDILTARHNHEFVINWLKEYPEYKNHDLYITGESYAGMYIPALVNEIVDHQKENYVNLKGFAIGNPCTDPVIDHNAFFDILSTHAILPINLQDEIKLYCPPTARYLEDQACCNFNMTNFPPQTDICKNKLKRMYELFSNNDLYDLYTQCITKIPDLPCDDATAITNFLNEDSVRAAIHAKSVQQIGNWSTCSERLDYTSNFQNSYHFYKKLLGLGLRVMIYSGDVDACVPYMGTQRWVYDLGRGEGNSSPVHDWNVWHVDGQVAGYNVHWQDISYVTVKGSGHMVPQFKPLQAYHMFERYLKGDFLSQ